MVNPLILFKAKTGRRKEFPVAPEEAKADALGYGTAVDVENE